MKLLNIIIFIFFLSFSTSSLAQISFAQRVLVEKNDTAGVDNDGFFIKTDFSMADTMKQASLDVENGGNKNGDD